MHEHSDHGTDMLGDRPQMVREREPDRLARLRHDVGRIDDPTPERCQRVRGPGAEERRNGAREQAPRAEDDHIGLADGAEYGCWSSRAGRLRAQPPDAPLRITRRRFSAGDRTVGVIQGQGETLDPPRGRRYL
jgi:hypothetical protein